MNCLPSLGYFYIYYTLAEKLTMQYSCVRMPSLIFRSNAGLLSICLRHRFRCLQKKICLHVYLSTPLCCRTPMPPRIYWLHFNLSRKHENTDYQGLYFCNLLNGKYHENIQNRFYRIFSEYPQMAEYPQ